MPEPTWERPFLRINEPRDAISIVVNDPGFQSTMENLFFGPHTKEARPGKPVFVKEINGKYEGYYLVPFYYQDELIGLAAIGLYQGKGKLVIWSRAEASTFPPLSADEARTTIERFGYRVSIMPELVHDAHFRYGGNPNAPCWKVESDDGKGFYVFYDFSKQAPLVYDVNGQQLLK